MSEGASQGAETLAPHGGFFQGSFKDEFDGGGGVSDVSVDTARSGLPPFSSLGVENGPSRMEGFTENGRYLDLNAWDYYSEGLSGRLLERNQITGEAIITPSVLHMHASQPQYRPWESKSGGGADPEMLKLHPAGIPPFTDAFGGSKLPSFQSQFTTGAFAEPVTNNGATVAAATMPPSEAAPGMPNFHTLTTATTLVAAPPRGYPLVPAPVQAREIPQIQQQILDERHIQLFHSQPPGFPPNQFPPGPPHHHVAPPHPHHIPAAYHLKPADEMKHFPPMDKVMAPVGPEHLAMGQLKFPGMQSSGSSEGMPQARMDSRKKERRKARVSSLDSSADSDIANAEGSGQVAAVSSTGSSVDMDDGFRRPQQASSSDNEMGGPDKPVKKKRKRCGECMGCQRKDNCGECAPCRNEKSHQICKQRRCEKLTEKKGLFGGFTKSRSESKRGKGGRGRGAGYRNRGGRGGSSSNNQQQQQQQSSSSNSANAAHDNMMAGINSAATGGETSNKMDSRSRPSVGPTAGSGAPPGQTAPPMVPGVMPTFYGNPPADPGFLPGRDRFPTPMWPQQQPGAESAPGWGSPHFQPTPQMQPHMEFQQPGLYQGYQPGGYAPPFEYPQDQRTGYGVQQQQQQQQQFAPRPPSSPARFPQQTHTPQPSPNNPTVNGGINGRQLNNGQYLEGSPSSAGSGPYVNGSAYQQEGAPSASPAPPGRNSSAGSVYEEGQQATKANGPGNNNTFSATTQNAPTGHPNEHPGYPLHLPQLSSQNSSGYSGSNNSVPGEQQPRQQQQTNNNWSRGGTSSTPSSEQNRNSSSWASRESQQPERTPPPPSDRGGTQSRPMYQNGSAEEESKMKKHYFNQQQHYHHQYSMENFGRENGQPPPETGPNFLVQGHPQTSLSEGGQFWDWAEGARMQHFGQELPNDVKDFISNRQKQSWSDDEQRNFKKPPAEKTSEKPIEAAAPQLQFSEFYGKDQNVTIKQESSAYAFSENSQEQIPVEEQKEVKKERMDVAAYLDQQKAAERNRRWSPTPPPVPQPPPEDYKTSISSKEYQEHMERLKNNIKAEVPDCSCFPPDKSSPPEPGSFYTHLGTAASLADLRKDMETRIGIEGKELRIEKVCYTGKEGKTQQGCPLAKWVIRRSSLEEKVLAVVKHRQGHKCPTAWIVICIVAWDGVPSNEAGRLYNLLVEKLNRFGLPTTRRCATNEPRTCACQGLDPDTCGASFSFGCSWSMYYNGCKYARSKTVRKFRLSVRTEEQEIEERMHVLSTLIAPLYKTIAPEAFANQTQFERDASECRLGFKPGRPFSGVTACLDFCAHSHRDLHNMNNGCTVVVSLNRHRSLSKPDDEQLHVLPLYVMDETDEFGSKEAQQEKVKSGAIENLTKFTCEVRVRSVPLQPCRRHGKKRKEDEPDAVIGKLHKEGPRGSGVHIDVSSTVLDSPVSMYQGWGQEGYHDAYWSRGWNGDCKNPNWWGDPLSEMKVDADSTTGLMRYAAQYSPSNPSSCPSTPQSAASASPFVFPPSWQQQQQQQVYQQTQSAPTTPTTPGPSISWQNENTPKKNPPTPLEEDTAARSAYAPPSTPPTPTFAAPNNPPPSDNSCLKGERAQSQRPPSTSWDYSSPPSTPQTPASPFRVPKARPPSRTHSNTSAASTESTPTGPSYCKGFLKPFPPSETKSGSSTSSWPAAGDDWPGKSEPGHSAWPEAHNNQSYPSGYGAGPSTANPFAALNNYSYGNSFMSGCNLGWNEPSYYCHPQQLMGSAPFMYQQGYPFYAPPHHPFFPMHAEPPMPRSEPIGKVTEICDNEECFKDSQMGGVAIALGHGSVLFECAKQELHSTTALRRPNRLRPSRISLVFYQHRNLNRARHGWDEWEEKMRLRKLGITTPNGASGGSNPGPSSGGGNSEGALNAGELMLLDRPKSLSSQYERATTCTTNTVTTLFPMHPCVVTGPYQENGAVG
ncbi:methylcytosine dioxygenase TET isoform X2 [Neocloeon triangulifer]|uniref:methylcytosine dioxygenase TET isoform X2 n=1 Tax=Neocloeon triangulifer TaxID=2078957 RepID=UPI00286F74BD|nr:methylcytosine dioxygenase TET isoform X2 [Neocloeon triangulifer]